MNLLPETHNIQSKLAVYCRNGIQPVMDGITPNRLHHYHRLVTSIIEDNLSSSFPIAYENVTTEHWNEMVTDFFSEHACQSYQVWKLAGEFYEYVLDNKYAEKLQLPYLNDLLKFEWVEMEVYNREDIPYPTYNKEGNLLVEKIIINPEFELLALGYPIHLEKVITAQHKPGNYFVVLYREKDTGKVQFVDLSVWFAFVIEQLAISPITMNELLLMAKQLFANADMVVLKETTIKFIEEMYHKKLIIGTI